MPSSIHRRRRPFLTGFAAFLLIGCAGVETRQDVINFRDVSKNYFPAIKTALECGADVNARDTAGDTALIVAARSGAVETAKLLIASGAGVNARNLKGETPLMCAAAGNEFELVKLFIKKDADVKARNAAGLSILTQAVDKQLFFVVKTLIEHGADVNARDQNGRTPLMHTAENNSFEIAKILLEHGADPDLKDIYGNTAIFIAKKKNNYLMIETLSGAPAVIRPVDWSKGKNIAVADFESCPPLSASDAGFITNFFRRALVNTRAFNVLDRNNMDKILAEQGFQQTGCTTADCAVQMGKLLNVQLIIVGSCGKLVSRYILTIDVIDVETSRIVGSFKEDCRTDSEIEMMVNRLAADVRKDF